MSNVIDLGHGHSLQWLRWHPDDLPGNRAAFGIAEGQPMPVIERCGAVVEHRKPDGSECTAAIHFDTPEVRRWMGGVTMWQVESWEPLTLSPSLLCKLCGDHGFIKQGKWVPA